MINCAVEDQDFVVALSFQVPVDFSWQIEGAHRSERPRVDLRHNKPRLLASFRVEFNEMS